MADLATLKAALVNADKAGDTAAAQKIAAAIRQMQTGAAPQVQPDPAYGNPVTQGIRGKILNDIGQGLYKFTTGIGAQAYGDATGLGAIMQDALASGADKISPNQTLIPHIDPAATRNAIVQQYTYQPTQPTVTEKIVSAPGRAISGGGEVIKRGVQSLSPDPYTQFLGDLAGQVPAGVAAYFGARPVPKAAPVAETAASRLRDQGVDLTPGQANPKGVVNKLEQGWERVPVIGEAIKNARQGAQKDFQRLTIEKASAPGTKITATDVGEMLDQAYQSFGPLYGEAKGFPVKAAQVNEGANVSLADSFKNAARDRNVQADARTRASTADWLANKLTALKAKPGQALDSGQLIELRSDIRAQIRKNASAKDAAKNDSAELLRNAEQAVTDALESQLPPDALLALKKADAQYSIYKVVEKAVAKAKDNPNGFTAENLSQAIKESTPANVYARGGGPLRQFSKDAKATFSSTEPMTGASVPSVALPAAAMLAKPAIGIPAGIASLLLTTTKAGRQIAANSGNAIATGVNALRRQARNALVLGAADQEQR